MACCFVNSWYNLPTRSTSGKNLDMYIFEGRKERMNEWTNERITQTIQSNERMIQSNE